MYLTPVVWRESIRASPCDPALTRPGVLRLKYVSPQERELPAAIAPLVRERDNERVAETAPAMTSLTIQDEEQLRLLAMFHHVVAGLGVLLSLLPVFHLAMGIMLLTGQLDTGRPTDGFNPAIIGWLFIAFPVVWIIAGLTGAVCMFLAGRHLRRRERYMFCQVIAGVMCVFVPFGTVLGVFTLLVLQRQTVRNAFAMSDAVRSSAP